MLLDLLSADFTGAWIEKSTLGRDGIVRRGKLAADHGVRALERAVIGGVHSQRAGKSRWWWAAMPTSSWSIRTALQSMGNRLFHLEPLGSAAVIKVITNMLAFVHLVADGEALMLAKRAGLDLAQGWQAIAASALDTDLRAPGFPAPLE